MGKRKGKRQFGRPEKKRECIIEVDFDELVDLHAREFGFLFLAVPSAFFSSPNCPDRLDGPRQPPI